MQSLHHRDLERLQADFGLVKWLKMSQAQKNDHSAIDCDKCKSLQTPPPPPPPKTNHDLEVSFHHFLRNFAGAASTAEKSLLNSYEAAGFERKFGLPLEDVVLGLFESKIKSISKVSVSNALAQATHSLSVALSEVIEESKSLNQVMCECHSKVTCGVIFSNYNLQKKYSKPCLKSLHQVAETAFELIVLSPKYV